MLAGQPYDPLHKTRFIIWNMPLPSLHVPMLTRNKTCPAFAQSITAENISDVLDRSPPLRRAQKVSCAAQGRPDAASRRSVLSFNDGSCIRLRPTHRNHVRSYCLVADRTPRWPPVPDAHDCG